MPSSNGLRETQHGRVDLELSPGRQAPAQARRALDRIDGLDPETLDDARLAVTELVANSVRHAGLRPRDRIQLGIEKLPDAVKVEVEDPGPGFEYAPRSAATEQSGRWGLHLIEHLASDWGMSRESGARVWCLIPRRTA